MKKYRYVYSTLEEYSNQGTIEIFGSRKSSKIKNKEWMTKMANHEALLMQGDHSQVIFDRAISGDLVVTVLIAGDGAWKPYTAVVKISEKEYIELRALFNVTLPQKGE